MSHPVTDSHPQWQFGEKGEAPMQPAGRRSFLVLAVFFSVVFILAVAAAVYEGWQLRQEALGHGRTAESYGFDLSNLNVDPDTLVASRMLRDEQPVLDPLPPYDHANRDAPSFMTLAEVDQHSDYPLWPVVPAQAEIVGVVAGGEARAYPIEILRGHEIVNDVLGGVPIAVTYSPLSDSAAVFDRRVGEEILHFGFSGLLSDSNLVMYDRRAEGGQEASLFSQLKMRAIAGPLAGESASEAAELKLMPTWIGRWEDWRAMQPRTTVLVGGEDYAKAYGPGPWLKYYAEGEPVFPVEPLPEGSSRELMAPVIVQRSDDGWQVRDAAVQDRDEPLQPTIRARWFAWYAAANSE